MGLLCTFWVTSISKPLSKDVSGNRGSSRARHHPRPFPDTALSLSVSPPSHANIVLQNVAPSADEEGQLPLLPKGPCVYPRCIVMTGKISFTSQHFFPFFNFLLGAKSRQALGDVRALTGFCGCHWLLQE